MPVLKILGLVILILLLLGARASIDVPLDRAASDLFRGGHVLTDTERDSLDLQGNHNGRYDLGDFGALWMRVENHP